VGDWPELGHHKHRGCASVAFLARPYGAPAAPPRPGHTASAAWCRSICDRAGQLNPGLCVRTDRRPGWTVSARIRVRASVVDVAWTLCRIDVVPDRGRRRKATPPRRAWQLTNGRGRTCVGGNIVGLCILGLTLSSALAPNVTGRVDLRCPPMSASAVVAESPLVNVPADKLQPLDVGGSETLRTEPAQVGNLRIH
jgi:hypothetical protein